MKDNPPITIIGAGFGGIAMGIALKQAGIDDFLILEKSYEIGGVWRDHRYPGIACDVPSVLYSYSFEQDYPWSQRYAPGAEIQTYLKFCADKYDVAPRIRFGAEIAEARFNDGTSGWTIGLTDGSALTSKILISAMGLFNKPRLPGLPGMDRFEGAQFHSGRWDHAVDLRGKRIAVVGTGASAIQFVPKIAPEAEKLLIFQRSAQYVTPMLAGRGANKFDPAMPIDQRQRERQEMFDQMVENAGRRYSPEMTAKAQKGFLDYLAECVPDPELRRKLTPAYPFGCKRVLRSDDWYPALCCDNVDLYDTPATAILPDGVETKDRQHHGIDVIIYNTGYRTTEYLSPVTFTGREGCDLNEAWADGAEAYLGMSITGFPNFFLLYGPNTNLSGSIIHMLECQAAYVTQAIQELNQRPANSVEVRADIQSAFNARIQEKISRSTMTAENCLSYFQTESGKIVTQWPGSMLDYAEITRELHSTDYHWR